MKIEEKEYARKLRGQGLSVKKITEQLGVAKSSVSLWVRDIQLTPLQKQRLSEKGISLEAIEKRRMTRLAHENGRRQIIINNAKKEIKTLSKRDLFLIGIALYWAEGGKTQRGLVRVTNGDPKIIEVMMRFLREICNVPHHKFRGYVHIHPHLDATNAVKYWSSISKIPPSRFFKTYRKQNKASKSKKDSLPYGTFDVYVCDTKLFLKIKGWIEGLHNKIISL